MSAFGKHGVRCDWCGKISNHPRGEYRRPVRNNFEYQLAGYIRMRSINGDDAGYDICDECADGVCPFCASPEIVQITPATPGPTGWGGRCKACGKQWEMPETPASKEMNNG